MTEPNVKQLENWILRYVDDAEPEDEGENEWCNENIKLVEDGSWEVDYKTEVKQSVYSVGNRFFMATFQRIASGYWSDAEYYDTEIDEVIPVEVTVTQWKVVKKENKND